ncbi:MAG: thioredoxin family protein [Candidatus Omnitrophica bacterium]|nr:thioredoxin family protein [Candidatus Omnitrophota bacterium]
MSRKASFSFRSLTAAAGIAVLLGLLSPAPAQVPSQLGKEVSPQTWPEVVAGFKGQATLVTFWEVTCEPCVEELPDLIEVHRELGPKGLRIASVNTDPEARFEAAARLTERLQLPFVKYYKKPGSDVAFRRAIDPEYAANPFAIIFSATGEKVRTLGEAHSKEEWHAILSPLLEVETPQSEARGESASPFEDPFGVLSLSGLEPASGTKQQVGSPSGSRSPFRMESPQWMAGSPDSGTLSLKVTAGEAAHLVLSTLAVEKIKGKGLHVGAALAPARELHYMEIRDETEAILRTPGELRIPVRWITGEEQGKDLQVLLTFSGCTDGPKGVCFPPETHSISTRLAKSNAGLSMAEVRTERLDPRASWPEPEEPVETTASPATASGDSILSRQALKDTGFFERTVTRNLWVAFLLAFIGGILTSFTPCVYPMIPATVAIFGAKEVRSRVQACSLAGTYILGVALSYASLGVVAAALGTVFGTMMENPWLIGVVALFYVVLALSMLDVFVFYLPSSWVSAASRVNRKGYMGAFSMGLVSSIVFAPCGEPILLGILTWVAKTQSFFLGFWLLFIYAWGIGVLFFVIATFSSSIRYLPKAGAWMVAVKDFFGLLLFGLALYWVHFVIPESWLWGLTTAYFLGVATFVSIKNQGTEGLSRAVLSFATMAALLAASLPLQRFAALQGWVPGVGMTAPADKPADHAETVGIAWLSGAPLADLERARASGKSVIVKYRTNVCEKCDELDHKVFSDPKVQRALERFVAIKVNLSESRSNKEVSDLQVRQGVFAVPVIEFYDSQGRFLPHKRIADVISVEEFLDLIKDIV